MSHASPTEPTVAFFGGSFNPPHVSHVLAATYALSVAGVDRVLVVPVYEHVFSKQLLPFEERLELCRLALGWLPGVEVSAVERDLGGESRTLRTLQHLKERHPEWRLRLLIGADVLQDVAKWHRFDLVAECAPPLVLGRAIGPGIERGNVLLPEVSSSQIRSALVRGAVEEVRHLLPAPVLRRIVERGLYRGDAGA